jgi:transaldolase
MSALRVDYIIAPLKVLQSLKESVTAPDEKYSFVRRLSPQSAATYSFSKEEVCFLLIFSLFFLHQDFVLN